MKYKDLPKQAQEVIDLTYAHFEDMFDNSEFGPFIEEFTPFNQNRLAQLFDIAMGNLLLMIKASGYGWNYKTFPYTIASARAALGLSLTCEIIRHLIISYVEIPDTSRVGAPDVVRRDYFTRWQSVLGDYENKLRDAAKKLDADLYEMEANGGRYIKTLVDFPSMASSVVPFNLAERPQFGWFW